MKIEMGQVVLFLTLPTQFSSRLLSFLFLLSSMKTTHPQDSGQKNSQYTLHDMQYDQRSPQSEAR